MSLFKVLGLLLIALLILIPLLERRAKTKNLSPEDDAKIDRLSRWIFPLLVSLIILQLLALTIS